MFPRSVSAIGAPPIGTELAPFVSGCTTIHSVGDRRGELSRGVEPGLERGVASVEHELRGVWGLCERGVKSVGVQECVWRGDRDGEGLGIFKGGTGLYRSSMSFCPRGNWRGGQGGI